MLNVLNELLVSKLLFENTLKNYFQNFTSPEVEERTEIFNSSQLLLNHRVQRDTKHKASHSDNRIASITE